MSEEYDNDDTVQVRMSSLFLRSNIATKRGVYCSPGGGGGGGISKHLGRVFKRRRREKGKGTGRGKGKGKKSSLPLFF